MHREIGEIRELGHEDAPIFVILVSFVAGNCGSLISQISLLSSGLPKSVLQFNRATV
jgi:hypothetical protein